MLNNLINSPAFSTRFIAILLCSTLLACGGGGGSSDTTPAKPDPVKPEAVELTWLRTAAVPLNSFAPDASDAELSFFDAKIGNISLIGLGEATFSSSEFQKMNHRIVRYLVEHKGVTVFGIEAQLGTVRALDRYIFEGIGDAKQALVSQATQKYITQEMLELVTWMRAYNLDTSHTKKIRVFGFDMQNGDTEVNQLLSYIQTVDAPNASAISNLYAPFKPYLGRGSTGEYSVTSPSFKAQIVANLTQAHQWLVDHHSVYSAASSEESYAWALQMAKVALQNEAFQSVDQTKPVNIINAQTVRNSAMADNVDWAKTNLGSNTKLAFHSHNAQVNKTNRGAPISMGNTLFTRHPTDYFTLGYAFYSGGFFASQASGSFQVQTDSAASTGSYEDTFSKANLNMAFLDLRNLSTTELGPVWMTTQHLAREHEAAWENSAGYGEVLTSLPKRFDAIIFIKTITPAKQIF